MIINKINKIPKSYYKIIKTINMNQLINNHSQTYNNHNYNNQIVIIYNNPIIIKTNKLIY